jgi:hypothetical protein
MLDPNNPTPEEIQALKPRGVLARLVGGPLNGVSIRVVGPLPPSMPYAPHPLAPQVAIYEQVGGKDSLEYEFVRYDNRDTTAAPPSGTGQE